MVGKLKKVFLVEFLIKVGVISLVVAALLLLLVIVLIFVIIPFDFILFLKKNYQIFIY